MTQEFQRDDEENVEAVNSLLSEKNPPVLLPPTTSLSCLGILCGKTQSWHKCESRRGQNCGKCLLNLHCVKPPFKLLWQHIDPPGPLQGLGLCKHIDRLCRFTLPCLDELSVSWYMSLWAWKLLREINCWPAVSNLIISNPLQSLKFVFFCYRLKKWDSCSKTAKITANKYDTKSKAWRWQKKTKENKTVRVLYLEMQT